MKPEGSGGVRRFQAMVPMRDGVRLNTFVFLPDGGETRHPVILQRTPYGIVAEGADPTDCGSGWLPGAAEPFRGSLLRGWEKIVAHGYAAVY
jgi:predicted acyl esterase